MISYGATWNCFDWIDRAQSGSGDVARQLDQEMTRLLEYYASPRLEMLISEIDELTARPNQGTTTDQLLVDADTARAAIEFALSLPRSLPAPEIAADSDGEIAFDWLGHRQKMFSVTINKDGRIAFAGRFSDRSKIHGTDQISESCPPDIIRGIAKAVS